MMVMSSLVLSVGSIMGGYTGIVGALIFAIFLNIFSFWKSDKLALRMARAKPALETEYPKLHVIVSEQCSLAAIGKPQVYIIDSPSPNAFATGRSPRHASIALTTGIIQLLTREELGAVIAHELAHVGNRDILIMSIVSTLASAVAMIAWMAKWSLLFGGFGGRGRSGGNAMFGIGGLLILAIVIPLLTTLVRLTISRTREFQADASGASTSGNPEALANALEKLDHGAQVHPMESNEALAHLYIVQPIHGQTMNFMNGKGMMRLMSTHPPTQERTKRLRRSQSHW
jgi:heat shock protein HtpX